MKDDISILVADNDPEIIKNAWMVLNNEGHLVEGVLSGKEAIHKLRQYNYDLVYTALMLRGIDGFTLIKWIKQYRPVTGIVAITDNPLKQSIKEAHKLGIISHIMKPFTAEMLNDVTNKTIEWLKENVLKNEQEEEFKPEMLAELDAVINQCRKTSSHPIRVLLHAQEIFGYLPSMIQKRIAQGLNMYPSEIRGIVSFYSCFRTRPKAVHIPYYTSGIEKAWNSVSCMTGKRAVNAVNEFIQSRQAATQ
jgi:CheY-like chemotaxis protein